VFITLEKNRDYPPVKAAEKNIPVIFYRANPIPATPARLKRFFKDFHYSWKLLNELQKEEKPNAVAGFGGYPVFPALIWALAHRIPVFQHEQNSVHGLITKLLYPFSRKLFLSFPRPKLSKKEILSGNPLRSIFLKHKAVSAKSGKISRIKHILIMGGSQGARDLNELYAILIRDPFFKDIKITISTGKQEFENVKKIARKNDEVFSFIEDVPAALKKSGLIISRSGSGSLYEILWSKKPALFFPYPFATANHQTSNALAVSDKMYYRCIDIRPFNGNAALKEIKNFIDFFQSKSVADPVSPLPLNAHQIIATSIIQDLP